MSTQPDPGQEDPDNILSDLKSIGMPIHEKMEFGVVKFDCDKTIISRDVFEFEAVDNLESILEIINTKEFGAKIYQVMSEPGQQIIRSKTQKWHNLDPHYFNFVKNSWDADYILMYVKSKSRVIHSKEIRKRYINLKSRFFTENDLGLINLI
jgi:hypothetical protein